MAAAALKLRLPSLRFNVVILVGAVDARYQYRNFIFLQRGFIESLMLFPAAVDEMEKVTIDS